MIVIPFIYFLVLFTYFAMRQKKWNMDLAATMILVIISLNAIFIDVYDIYGDYGINDNNITLPTLILFCIQWTLVLIPIHLLSNIPLQQHMAIKEKALYVFFVLMTLSSVLMIYNQASDIQTALVMDMAEVRQEHYQELHEGGSGESNYLMLPATILTSSPFPTLALFFWFYMKAFMKSSVFLRVGILSASIIQAILGIVIAGRAAMIYWAFDFFMLFSYFYQYLSKEAKRSIILPVFILGGAATFLLITITVSRFDAADMNRTPLESLYGYAGQHVNNFCTMFVHGKGDAMLIDRVFPLLSKLLTKKSFDLAGHYDLVSAHVSGNVRVNVFDTFGGELYLDLGWFGYVGFFMLLMVLIIYIKSKWKVLEFHNVFIFIIVVVFFTKGLFAWPFVYHYTTYALLMFLLCRYFFKYVFKI